MAMSIGGGGTRAEINMTPMIDVLLVLIIIFMVITPLAPRGLETTIPRDDPKGRDGPPARAIVLSVSRDGVRINQEALSEERLPERLAAVLRNGGDVFVRGDLEYRDVARVIDIARGAGAGRVGLMTR